MGDLLLTSIPVMRTGMLIRKPAAEVFEAFIDPASTSQFWFTHGSGRLVEDGHVTWEWRMYGVSAEVEVKTVEPDRRIVIGWGGGGGHRQTVEWTFTPISEGTFVAITCSGFQGTADELVNQVTDSMQGFSLLLAGAKAFLEHGIRLNLTADRYPKGLDAGM